MTFIDIHSHNSSIEKNTIKVVNQFPDVFVLSKIFQYTSVGLHPWYIKDNFKELISSLKTLTQYKQVIAIGEAGLDKAIDTDIELQKSVFIAQAIIAEKISKPMIIHAVKSYYDIIAIRKNFANAPPWIIHGFTGNENIARELVKNNFYLSFGKDLFGDKSHASKVISAIPLANLFLETDDSDRNIKNIYEKAADLLNMSIEKLSTTVSNNFQKLFSVDLCSNI